MLQIKIKVYGFTRICDSGSTDFTIDIDFVLIVMYVLFTKDTLRTYRKMRSDANKDQNVLSMFYNCIYGPL